MPILDQIPTLPTANDTGTLTGAEKVGVIDNQGLPSQTTAQAIADLAGGGGTPLPVAQGGTGASSLTDHGVLVGSGTGAVTPLAVGTNGQILVGATGADPAFQTMSGDATLASNGAITIANGAVSAAKLADAVADALVVATATQGAEAGDKIILSVQMKDVQGNNLAVATNFWIEPVSAVDVSYALSDDGAGSIVYFNTGSNRAMCTTDATGLAEIGVTDTAAQTIKLAIGGGPGTPFMQGPAVLDLVFV